MDHLQMAWKESKERCKPTDKRVSHQLRMLEGLGLSKISKGAFVQGRRLPVSKKDFERICELYAEGAFMSKCGLWQRMEKKLVALDKRENRERQDEQSEAEILQDEDKRAIFQRRSERGQTRAGEESRVNKKLKPKSHNGIYCRTRSTLTDRHTKGQLHPFKRTLAKSRTKVTSFDLLCPWGPQLTFPSKASQPAVAALPKSIKHASQMTQDLLIHFTTLALSTNPTTKLSLAEQ